MNCEYTKTTETNHEKNTQYESQTNKPIISSCFIDAEHTKHVMAAIDTCQRIYTHDQFKLLLSSSITTLIPFEFAVCGIGLRGRSSIDHIINVNQDENKIIPSFSNTTIEKLFKSLIEKSWNHPAGIITNKNGDIIIVNNNQWLITMRQFKVSNIIEISVIDKLGRYTSYFCFALCKENITPAHRLILKYLIPHLHIALTNVFYKHREDIPKDSTKLSAREIEVLNLIYLGYKNAYIAEILGLSVNTVKNHVHKILKKLHVGNRTQALTKSMGLGIINPSYSQTDRVL